MCGGFGSDSEDRVDLVRIAIERGKALMAKDLSRMHIFVIGDSPYDVLAGKANGVKTIAVGTGRSNQTELLKTGPTALLADLSDTRAFLNVLGE